MTGDSSDDFERWKPRPRSLEEWRAMRVPGLNEFLAIAVSWQLSEAEQVGLLQCGTIEQLQRWISINQTNDALVMGNTSTERLFAVAAVAEAASYVYPIAKQCEWLRRPNNGPAHGGKPPIDILTDGGVGDIWTIRRYLMGLTQGGPAPNQADQNFHPYKRKNIIWC